MLSELQSILVSGYDTVAWTELTLQAADESKANEYLASLKDHYKEQCII